MKATQGNVLPFSESAFTPSHEPFYFEDLARAHGFEVIAGVDEAGRGPLAGPVVAAAVIIPEGRDLPGIRDSKKMTPKAREEAFSRIISGTLSAGIGVVSSAYIDRNNILNATLEAMRRAMAPLDPRPEFVLVDGIQKIPLPIPQRCLKGGDRISRSISAASVLAKVYRDRIMTCYHRMYPSYGFDKHKGYGTRGHLEALAQNGPSPIHRKTFRRVRELVRV